MRSIWPIIMSISIMLIIYACSNGGTNGGTNSGTNMRISIPEGHGNVKIFDSIEFDTIPQTIVIGQKVKFIFKINPCQNYRTILPQFYDVVDSAHIDSFPILIDLNVSGRSLDASRTLIRTPIDLDNDLLKYVEPDTKYIPLPHYIGHDWTGHVFLRTTLNDIVSGKVFTFTVRFPREGNYEIHVNTQYHFSSCDQAYLEERGHLQFKVQ